MKQLLVIVAMILLNQEKMEAQKIKPEEIKDYISIFESKVTIPKAFGYQSAKTVMVDGISALVIRYEKQVNKGTKGEHFSFVISEKEKQTLGFTNMDKKYSDLSMLSKSQTEKIAKDFLLKLDEDLAKDLKNLWVERHDEEINVDGKPVTIAGMKYKCYRASEDNYAWVIVGFDGSVITFERNIKWDNTQHRRITEKWLHDKWLSENKLENQ